MLRWNLARRGFYGREQCAARLLSWDEQDDEGDEARERQHRKN